MIGEQETGRIKGAVISAVCHEGLKVTVDGRPAQLAIVNDEGKIIASGKEVAQEAEAVTINSYRNLLKGKGFLRVYSKPIPLT